MGSPIDAAQDFQLCTPHRRAHQDWGRPPWVVLSASIRPLGGHGAA